MAKKKPPRVEMDAPRNNVPRHAPWMSVQATAEDNRPLEMYEDPNAQEIAPGTVEPYTPEQQEDLTFMQRLGQKHGVRRFRNWSARFLPGAFGNYAKVASTAGTLAAGPIDTDSQIERLSHYTSSGLKAIQPWEWWSGMVDFFRGAQSVADGGQKLKVAAEYAQPDLENVVASAVQLERAGEQVQGGVTHLQNLEITQGLEELVNGGRDVIDVAGELARDYQQIVGTETQQGSGMQFYEELQRQQAILEPWAEGHVAGLQGIVQAAAASIEQSPGTLGLVIGGFLGLFGLGNWYLKRRITGKIPGIRRIAGQQGTTIGEDITDATVGKAARVAAGGGAAYALAQESPMSRFAYAALDAAASYQNLTTTVSGDIDTIAQEGERFLTASGTYFADLPTRIVNGVQRIFGQEAEIRDFTELSDVIAQGMNVGTAAVNTGSNALHYSEDLLRKVKEIPSFTIERGTWEAFGTFLRDSAHGIGHGIGNTYDAFRSKHPIQYMKQAAGDIDPEQAGQSVLQTAANIGQNQVAAALLTLTALVATPYVAKKGIYMTRDRKHPTPKLFPDGIVSAMKGAGRNVLKYVPFIRK
ncbi:MAG: hypothetical protein OXR66_06320 [Candidatus Woesearchaeota archaeon]|nr:hypothetical protein [Candidatus Woesearchaeota archaeon]